MSIGKVFNGTSYYKQIDNQTFDRSALRKTKRAMSGERDGRVSKTDAKRVAKSLVDGGSYTKTERRTAALIRKEANITAAGRKQLDHDIRSAGQLRHAPVAKQ